MITIIIVLFVILVSLLCIRTFLIQRRIYDEMYNEKKKILEERHNREKQALKKHISYCLRNNNELFDDEEMSK